MKQNWIPATLVALGISTVAHAAVSITPGYENPGTDGDPFLYDAKGTFSDASHAMWSTTASVGGWSFADLRGGHNYFGTPIGADTGWGHASAWYLVEIQQATLFTFSMTSVSVDARPGFVIYAGESVNDNPGEAHRYSNNLANMGINAGWDHNGPGGTPGLTFVANAFNPDGSSLSSSVYLTPGLYTIAAGNIGNSTLATGSKNYDITMTVPEPSSLLAAMTGGLLLLARRRR